MRLRLRQPPFASQLNSRSPRRTVAGNARQAGSAPGAVYRGISGRGGARSEGLGAPRQFWPAAGSGGRRAGGRTQWQEVAQLLPDEPDAWFHLGNLAYNAGSYPRAQDLFREALKRKPDCLEALNGLGLSLAAQGQAKEAIREYRAALRLSPSFSAARVNLAVALANAWRDSGSDGRIPHRPATRDQQRRGAH